MKKRVAVFLAVSSVAVAIENVVYLRASSPSLVDPSDALAESPADADGAAVPGAIGVVCADALGRFLAALPDLERARSSFLTRAEDLALAATRPLEDEAGLQSLVLEGTLVNAERRIAWFDGIAASEGDWVGDHTVLRIEPRSVVVRKGADQLRIDLREPAVADGEP